MYFVEQEPQPVQQRKRFVTNSLPFVTLQLFPHTDDLTLLPEQQTMKEFFKKTENFTKIEFWAATAIFVFLVFFHIRYALSNEWIQLNNTSDTARTSFNYFFISRLVWYTVLYGSFLLLNFLVVPKLLRKEALLLNIVFIVAIYVLVSTVFGATDTYLKMYLIPGYDNNEATRTAAFQKSFLYCAWLLLLFGFYCIIRYTGLYLLSNAAAIQEKYKFITPGTLVAFVLWMITMFLLLISKAERGINAGWAIIIPCAILFYAFSFHTLIPKALLKRKPLRFYLLRTILLAAVSFFPVWVLGMAFTKDEEPALAISFFNILFQLFITLPLSWLVYRRYIRGNEEIYSLKKELGQSNANFDFLRSQINPHFLFNALNTIYGTAIQEKAERTSDGIERLGDMMRFMLQENMQKTISVSREIDYLHNYIALQKLRTDPHSNIKIEAEIEQQVQTMQIAPMLLIPFVENAFKHGISFREPSYINVTLETKNNTLYFDVANSKHAKQENDPEKNKSGIGLNNVRQRLQLLYAGKHELVIRETKKDFFIHLTLQLA